MRVDTFPFDSIPAPGSKEAGEKGCQCPVLDNAYGKGYLGDGRKFGWVINGDCPLHGLSAESRRKALEKLNSLPAFDETVLAVPLDNDDQ